MAKFTQASTDFDATKMTKLIQARGVELKKHIDNGVKKFYIVNMGVDTNFKHLGYGVYLDLESANSGAMASNVSMNDLQNVEYRAIESTKVTEELAKKTSAKSS